MSQTKQIADIDERLPDADDHQAMYRHFQERAKDTNVNQTTLLTTDYLNHFNGFMMLLEMLPMAPEDMAEELLAWEPMSYAEHFASSGFRDKELAVAAYAHVPLEIIRPFEETIYDLDQLVIELRECVRGACDQMDVALMQQIADVGVPKMKFLIEHAGSIVNGVVVDRPEFSQSTIDALFD